MDHARNFYQTILKSSHPLMLTLHLGAKVAPILFYLLGSVFLKFTAQFIVVILFLTADFYLTKNISGRKLVQLRWWYEPTTLNAQTFRFESYKQYAPGPPINPIDSKLFWWSLYLTPITWAIFAVFCVLRLKVFYLLLVGVAITLTGWNAYGFRSCERWDPNANSQVDGGWFQIPAIPVLDNLSRFSAVQSFFQSRS